MAKLLRHVLHGRAYFSFFVGSGLNTLHELGESGMSSEFSSAVYDGSPKFGGREVKKTQQWNMGASIFHVGR